MSNLESLQQTAHFSRLRRHPGALSCQQGVGFAGNFAHDFCRGFDRTDQAYALAHVESHGFNIAISIPAGWNASEPGYRHGLAANAGVSDNRLIFAGLLSARLLPCPLVHKRGAQDAVRRVGPAMGEKNSTQGVILGGLNDLLFVEWMGI